MDRNNQNQDWTPVVLKKNKPSGGQASKTASSQNRAVNQALRSGQNVETIKKSSGGANKQPTGPQTSKLDDEVEEMRHEKVPVELRKALQQARQAKKLTQGDLAKAINEQPKTVQEYENGKAIPSQQVLSKLEKHLGVKLRGGKKK